MDAKQKTVAQNCKDAAESNTMTFPQIIGTLMESGFESYTVDFRRQAASYYLPNGESVEFGIHASTTPIATSFDAAALTAAIREAQSLVPGYTYKGFCIKAKAAGCAGYMVSFFGKRVLYFARTAETHVERFPAHPQI